eukprot:TRINITY_DN4298_c0_g1_i1.p1 TRINITY_DN4298_c0_g1~~TRINITY_DN4298_c0_g1_i1.p1  ORF type:complete len:117 (+),score=24.15 TRINITY_DN4298_c0_g1_i1:87-437(+)
MADVAAAGTALLPGATAATATATATAATKVGTTAKLGAGILSGAKWVTGMLPKAAALGGHASILPGATAAAASAAMGVTGGIQQQGTSLLLAMGIPVTSYTIFACGMFYLVKTERI